MYPDHNRGHSRNQPNGGHSTFFDHFLELILTRVQKPLQRTLPTVFCSKLALDWFVEVKNNFLSKSALSLASKGGHRDPQLESMKYPIHCLNGLDPAVLWPPCSYIFDLISMQVVLSCPPLTLALEQTQ